jgi:hypothetical protein
MKNFLNEGLKKNELDEMVLPLLSIDEYESKINDATNIVVAMYVTEKSAADDLANFIERSPYNIQDIESSFAPTTDGHYVVFFELLRTPEFSRDLISILDEVSRVANNYDWQFTGGNLKTDDIEDLNEKTLKDNIDTKIKSPEQKKLEEFYDFFRNSSLTNVEINDNHLILEKHNNKVEFIVESFGGEFPLGKFDLNTESSAHCIMIEKFLCERDGNYSVNSVENTIIVENLQKSGYLCIRPL